MRKLIIKFIFARHMMILHFLNEFRTIAITFYFLYFFPYNNKYAGDNSFYHQSRKLIGENLTRSLEY